jgi:hypothetical protein
MVRMIVWVSEPELRRPRWVQWTTGRRGVKAGVVVGSASTLRRRLRTRLALACAQAAEITVRLFGALRLQF